MKLYLKELIGVTTPSENIVALDKLRNKYGDVERDEGGSFFRVDGEVVRCLPEGTTFGTVRQGHQAAERVTIVVPTM